ncbi:NAD-dependent protein deacetylase sirtuin-1 [Globomyces sp. JEL0801]|nr:NAD-dependent protein deacetylase sirtuin-1 [Globomyces sp. JEL0801]
MKRTFDQQNIHIENKTENSLITSKKRTVTSQTNNNSIGTNKSNIIISSNDSSPKKSKLSSPILSSTINSPQLVNVLQSTQLQSTSNLNNQSQILDLKEKKSQNSQQLNTVHIDSSEANDTLARNIQEHKKQSQSSLQNTGYVAIEITQPETTTKSNSIISPNMLNRDLECQSAIGNTDQQSEENETKEPITTFTSTQKDTAKDDARVLGFWGFLNKYSPHYTLYELFDLFDSPLPSELSNAPLEELLPIFKSVFLHKKVPYCPKCPDESGVMKPDIVFFGENLPSVFHDSWAEDRKVVDLLIVMGSSLKVAPVADVKDRIPIGVPQILINMESLPHMERFDIHLLGYCDTITTHLLEELDWIPKSHPTKSMKTLPGLISPPSPKKIKDDGSVKAKYQQGRLPWHWLFDGAKVHDVRSDCESEDESDMSNPEGDYSESDESEVLKLQDVLDNDSTAEIV